MGDLNRGKRGFWVPALAVVALAAIFAASAGAHVVDPAEVDELTHAQLATVLGEDFTRNADGLFRVRLPGGGSVLTHGPDPRSSMNQLDLEAALPAGASSRQPICATDYYQHVLYGHVAGTPDLIEAQAPVIRSAMNEINALLAADSVGSGGVTADYKVLCDESGQVKIDSFTAPTTAFSDIVAAAKAAGFRNPRADYTIFFDGPSSACGIGSYAIDDSLSADNRSNTGGGYGVSYQGCWQDETPMHENAHTQGAVQAAAPNSTGSGGHCYEERDVLCYSPDGGDRNQAGVISRCTFRVSFDCNNDDYFDSAPEEGEYLASHWNLGSALNRFIVFGQGAQIASATGTDIGTGNSTSTASTGGQVDPPCSTKSCAVPISEDGSERTGSAAPTGAWSFYRLKAARGLRSLDVVLRGPACSGACETNLDLYVRAKQPPSEKRSDCSSKKPGSNEMCRLKRPRAKALYVGVRSVKAAPGASFAIRTVAHR
jgi:hypothetical protein